MIQTLNKYTYKHKYACKTTGLILFWQQIIFNSMNKNKTEYNI